MDGKRDKGFASFVYWELKWEAIPTLKQPPLGADTTVSEVRCNLEWSWERVNISCSLFWKMLLRRFGCGDGFSVILHQYRVWLCCSEIFSFTLQNRT